MISLATIPTFIINIPKRPDDPKEFNILFSFSLNSSNAVHNLIKSMHLDLKDKINFNIQLSGFSTGLTNSFENINFTRTDQSIDLHVVDYMTLVSTYYNDLSWIPVSRDTYSMIKRIADSKGSISIDEVLRNIIDIKEK
jgi:hypothetical protein